MKKFQNLVIKIKYEFNAVFNFKLQLTDGKYRP